MRARGVTEGPRAPAAAAPKTDGPAKPKGIIYVTDSQGRKIGLRKLSASQRFEIDDKIEAKTLSAGLQIKFVASVVSIDQEGLPVVESRKDVLERLDLLDDHGLEAITQPCLDLYGIDLNAAEKAQAKN
jgi:hypothetical protein